MVSYGPTRGPFLAGDLATEWRRFSVSPWYGEEARELEVATGTALWYHTGMPPVALRWVLVREVAGELASKAFFSTDLKADPIDILSWFVRRWQVEVTFEAEGPRFIGKVRRHLGVETQRQWSEMAIERSTPCLLGLFSLVTLMADGLEAHGKLTTWQTSWYRKPHPTFSDALAAVRQRWWRARLFSMSDPPTESMKIPRLLFEHLTRTISYSP